MDRVEAHGGDEATEADDEHGAHDPRVGVRRDATEVGQAHEVAEDVPAGRAFARVGAGLAGRRGVCLRAYLSQRGVQPSINMETTLSVETWSWRS